MNHAYIALAMLILFTPILRAIPLSPESVEQLRQEGRLEEVQQRYQERFAKGIDIPGENILTSMRELVNQVGRDNPDEITLRCLVVLVDFEDNEADRENFSAEHFERLLFSQDEFDPGSMREWYLENSYGEVDVTGDVVGWIRLPETYEFYVDGRNGTGNYPRNSQGMTRHAVEAIDDDVDFSNYDNDDDGSVDALFIVHAGPGAEANGGDENMIWSHAWALNNNRVQLDDVWINRYSTEPEDGQIGVFGHEAGHALFGLPDVYDTDYSSAGTGMWSMMSGGSWGGGGRSPVHFDAWCKKTIGFTDPQVLDRNLNDVEILPIEEDDDCYVLWENGNVEEEYYLIENRQQIGFDSSLPASGLLIYHVDESVQTGNRTEWYPGHQNQGNYLLAVEQADGNWDLEHNENRGDEGDPYPGSENNRAFNPATTPGSNSYAGDTTWVAVNDIRVEENNIICDLRILNVPPQIEVTPVEANLLNDEDLEIVVENSGEGDLYWHSSIEILELPEGDPGEYGYSYDDNRENEQPQFDWIGITETGENIGAGDDWVSDWIDLGFEFNWYGQPSSRVRVASNGWITFKQSAERRHSYPEPPNEAEPNSVLWVNEFDLDPREEGAVFVWTNNEDTFIASWVDIPRYGNAEIRSTFQCILNSDGSVKYQYGPHQGANGVDQNIGWENQTGTVGTSIIFNEEGTIEEGLAIEIDSDFHDVISWTPSNGIVQPEEDAAVMVDFNPDVLDDGDYEFDLHFYSNDPDNNDIAVNILLTVNSGPDMVVEPDLINFGDVEVGQEQLEIITISNTGFSNLVVTDIVTENDVYEAIFQGDLIVEVDESVELPIRFTPDAIEEERGLLRFETNDLEVPVLEILLLGNGVAPPPPEPEHFVDVSITNASHSLLALSMMHGDEPVPTGWEVGVFTPDDFLAGAAVWVEDERIGISVWGDDEQTEEVDGFRVGELMNFMVWDPDSDTEYAAIAEMEEGEQNWQNNGFSVLHLASGLDRELTVEFQNGWNMKSINVSPGQDFYRDGEDRGPDVIRMMEQLRLNNDEHIVEIMKDEFGRFYSPAFNFNNIPYWDLSRGYQVKVSQDVEAAWTGAPIPFDTEIQVRNGWNLVAYFPQYELDAGSPDFYVLSSILDNLVTAKDGAGRFMASAFNFSNMLPWRETEGYQIKVEDDVVLQYPEHQEELAYFSTESDRSEFERVPSSENMSLLINSIQGIDASENKEIHAFNTNGKLSGKGQLEIDGRCGLAVWGDDMDTEMIEGALDGEALTLRLWDEDQQIYKKLELLQVLAGEGLTWEKNALSVVNMSAASEIPQEYSLAEPYPNPFNSEVHLRFGLPEKAQVTLEIRDINGKLIKTLSTGHVEAGMHTQVWRAGNVPSGMYFVAMNSAGFSTVRKAMLVR